MLRGIERVLSGSQEDDFNTTVTIEWAEASFDGVIAGLPSSGDLAAGTLAGTHLLDENIVRVEKFSVLGTEFEGADRVL